MNVSTKKSNFSCNTTISPYQILWRNKIYFRREEMLIEESSRFTRYLVRSLPRDIYVANSLSKHRYIELKSFCKPCVTKSVCGVTRSPIMRTFSSNGEQIRGKPMTKRTRLNTLLSRSGSSLSFSRANYFTRLIPFCSLISHLDVEAWT